MSAEWYVSQNGQQTGPFTPAQLKQMAATGNLTPTDLVTKAGSKQWTPAQQIKGLSFAGNSAVQADLPPLPVPKLPPLPVPQLPPLPLPTTASAVVAPRTNQPSVLLLVSGAVAGIFLIFCLGIGTIQFIGRKSDKVFVTTPVSMPTASKEPTEPTEAEAREKLSLALYLWKGGRYGQELIGSLTSHKVEFVDPDNTDGFVLHRYDIERCLRDSLLKRWTITASLVFSLKDSGQFIRYEREYIVAYPDERGVSRITVRLRGVAEPVR